MIRILPFEVEDAFKITLRQQDTHLKDWLYSQAVLHKEYGIGFSVWLDDQILLCIGADILWKGVGEIWTLFDIHYFEHRFSLQKIVKNIIKQFFAVDGLHRLQSPIPARNTQSVRYAESMGFKPEGTLKMFDSDKNDYVMFARYS